MPTACTVVSAGLAETLSGVYEQDSCLSVSERAAFEAAGYFAGKPSPLAAKRHYDAEQVLYRWWVLPGQAVTEDDFLHEDSDSVCVAAGNGDKVRASEDKLLCIQEVDVAAEFRCR